MPTSPVRATTNVPSPTSWVTRSKSTSRGSSVPNDTVESVDNRRSVASFAVPARAAEAAPARPEDEGNREADDPDDEQDDPSCMDVEARRAGVDRPDEDRAGSSEQQ